VTRQVPLVQEELPILPEHPSSPSFLSGVHVAQSLAFWVVICRSLFLSFLFGYCFVSFDFRLLITSLVSAIPLALMAPVVSLLLQIWWLNHVCGKDLFLNNVCMNAYKTSWLSSRNIFHIFVFSSILISMKSILFLLFVLFGFFLKNENQHEQIFIRKYWKQIIGINLNKKMMEKYEKNM
jgi:hypothetical protein